MQVMVALSRCLSCLVLLVGSVAGARIARRHRHGGFDLTDSCGQKRDPPSPMTNDINMSIINGRPAQECAWPWQIYIGGCGATLIAPDWVLSAAHCSTPQKVYAGLHNRSRFVNVPNRTVVQRIDHPRYSGFGGHDMMLLKLDSPFDLDACVNIACLPTTKPQVGETDYWITGWGSIEAGIKLPAILQEASVNVISCSNSGGGGTSTDVCVKGPNNEQACSGDSGGPLVREVGGRWTVFGATSRGGPYCNSGTVYTGVYDDMDFITSHINVAPTPAPPPGNWELIGTGCEMDGNCIQSSNHPSNYGNSEECTIQITGGSISLSVDAFNTEAGFDKLTIGGRSYAGTSGPASGSYTGTITWSSDSSVSKSGWRLCRTD